MGLKFKKFKAKLNWKTKETVPEVVCLRYQIHSEFENIASPISPTSNDIATRLQANDVLKQKKVTSKPQVQNVFEENNIPISLPIDINTNAVNHDVTDEISVNNNEEAATSGKPKSILKKFNPDENLTAESVVPGSQNFLKAEVHKDLSNAENDKSALIFMTENHDYTNNTNEIKEETPMEAVIELNTKNKTTENTLQNIKVTETTINEEQIKIKFRSDLLSEKASTDELDTKTVNWRKTVEYYSDNENEPVEKMSVNKPALEKNKPSELNDVEDLEFKIHFVTHKNISKMDIENADSENEYDSEVESETEVDTNYRSRGAYSSQAASIFFAGEDPEPPSRVRNVQLPDDDDKVA